VKDLELGNDGLTSLEARLNALALLLETRTGNAPTDKKWIAAVVCYLVVEVLKTVLANVRGS
jgi:hypothetical protein